MFHKKVVTVLFNILLVFETIFKEKKIVLILFLWDGQIKSFSYDFSGKFGQKIFGVS